MKYVNEIHEDSYIERMAEFYTSDMVKELQPHIREIPFHEWLRRETAKRDKYISWEDAYEIDKRSNILDNVRRGIKKIQRKISSKDAVA